MAQVRHVPTVVGNVFPIDTKMFGFDRFNAAYLVVSDEVALIDTGPPLSWPVVTAAIAAHGFSLGDIRHVIVTHAEHPDHSGNVGVLVKENERASVYVHPLGAAYLTDPAVEAEIRRKKLAPRMAARFGEMEPVPQARLTVLADGDVIDVGGGVRLRVVFTPGHQPGGLVVYEEKHAGLFINDLCGAYFADADASWVFTPNRADVRQAMASLEKIEDLPAQMLYLGHYGTSDRPRQVLDQALAKMQGLLDIGEQCMSAGRPGDIEKRVLETLTPEVEKMGRVRDEALYTYLRDELTPSLAQAFAAYYRAQA